MFSFLHETETRNYPLLDLLNILQTSVKRNAIGRISVEVCQLKRKKVIYNY